MFDIEMHIIHSFHARFLHYHGHHYPEPYDDNVTAGGEERSRERRRY